MPTHHVSTLLPVLTCFPKTGNRAIQSEMFFLVTGQWYVKRRNSKAKEYPESIWNNCMQNKVFALVSWNKWRARVEACVITFWRSKVRESVKICINLPSTTGQNSQANTRIVGLPYTVDSAETQGAFNQSVWSFRPPSLTGGGSRSKANAGKQLVDARIGSQYDS